MFRAFWFVSQKNRLPSFLLVFTRSHTNKRSNYYGTNKGIPIQFQMLKEPKEVCILT